ncbi:MAG: inorganic phosphate transporter [Chitinophagales bacterium]|nr:inorganic phosphate transporter [Chitinophagales bacterium]
MDLPFILIVIVILSLVFDFINGFHDSANSIATVVSTKTLTPLQAVVWAAFWNFIAFFVAAYIIGEFRIGNTIAEIVFQDFITLEVIFSGIVAAIVWNLFTWWFGIPSSSSHTLIGGFMGAALVHAMMLNYNSFKELMPEVGAISLLWISINKLFTLEVINLHKVVPVFLFIFSAPFIGAWVAIIINTLILHLFKNTNPHKAEKIFKRLQLFSSGLFSLGHGLNDAQKVMGIIGAAVIYYHVQMLQDPVYTGLNESEQFGYFTQHYIWVPFTSFLVIGLGTLAGGSKIIKTMGTKITKVTSLEGVSAETAGAATLFLTDHLGIPVSTTHTITGSIIGVGLTKRVSAVRWGVTVSLVWAWVLTIPISAMIAGGVYLVFSYI